MSYYTRSRSRESPAPDWLWWVVGVAAFLMICGLSINLVSAWRRGGVEKSIAAVEVSRVEALDKIDPAEQEIRENGGKFAPHWSAAFPDQLKQARQNLTDKGQVVALINQAQTELKADHIDEAKSFVDQADKVVIASLDVVNKILGPPTFYVELQRKSDEVDRGFLETVKAEIVRQQSYVDGLERRLLCDSSDKRLSFKRAYLKIDEAGDLLAVADGKSREVVEGWGVDKPVVYDAAFTAYQAAQSATTSANQDIADLDATNAAISSAEVTINNSNAYILISLHETFAATTALDGARSTLTLARQTCYNEDFAGAISLANHSQSQASIAQSIATPPTPVPVVIIVQDQDNNDSGGWSSSWDSGGSSDSGSTGGSGWGSDSGSDNSWSSGSDWGGSDNSWSSGSDWGGSDSSWDSGSDWGGSDSGSWDSGSDW